MMNLKLALLSAAMLAVAPAAYADDADTATTTDATAEAMPGETVAVILVPAPNLGGINPAAGTDYFNDWDANQDVMLSLEEFDKGIEQMGSYDAWDADGDGMLNKTEYSAGMYDIFDSNDDDMVEEDEFSWSDGGNRDDTNPTDDNESMMD